MPEDGAVFRLKPRPEQLPRLAQCYLDAQTRDGRRNEDADHVALDAGRRIRQGDRTKETLKEIVAWKNSESRFWMKIGQTFDGNDTASVTRALNTVVHTEDPQEAVAILVSLKGIGVPTASAILAMIFPERYTVIDQRALRAVGIADPETAFYLLYNAYCRATAIANKVCLRTLDRALWASGGRRRPK